jgi:uncharacterized protein YggE
MKKFGLYLLTMLLGLFLSCNSYAADNTVTVIGKAERKFKPDIAFVTLYIKADGILMTDAAKNADQKIDEVRKAIQEKFKSIKSFDVSDVSVGEAQRGYWGPDKKEERPHPEISRRIRITIEPNPIQAYELIDTAIRAGALMDIPSSTRYQGDVRSIVMYGLLKTKEIEIEVREAALANAKQEAQKLATLAGKKLGDVSTIGCSGSCSYDFPMRIMGFESDFPNEYITTNSKEINVRHNISVTYELKKD